MGKEEERVLPILFLQAFVSEYREKLKALTKKGEEMESNYKRLLVSE